MSLRKPKLEQLELPFAIPYAESLLGLPNEPSQPQQSQQQTK
jgi:hypothetical protein